MALCHSQVSLMLSTDINITETTYPASFNMYLVINMCVTVVKVSNSLAIISVTVQLWT